MFLLRPLRPLLRIQLPRPSTTTLLPRRYKNTIHSPPSVQPAFKQAAPPAPKPSRGIPAYMLTFTCRPCQERSTHEISKQAYHHGSVAVQCPGCNNRHVVADHLKIFGEQARSFEEILKERGETMKYGVVTYHGDVEVLPEEEGEGKQV